jgi:hypothetical protein
MNKMPISMALALLFSLLPASATFAASEPTGTQVPFKGSLQAVETYEVDFPTLYVDASGSGNATHLGRYTVSYEVAVDIPTGHGSASAQFVAANGDTLLAEEGSGQATPTETPNVIMIEEDYTITGGTGRFAGATGSFTVLRVLNQVTGVTSGTIDGNIVFLQGK